MWLAAIENGNSVGEPDTLQKFVDVFRDDPRKVAALRRLSIDADTEVGETARIALLA